MPGEQPFQRFKSGQVRVEPRQLNEPLAALEMIRNIQVGAGLYLVKDPAGWFLGLTGPGNAVLFTPPEGIDAATRDGTKIIAGQADCTLYVPTDDGWDLATDPEVVVPVWNMAVGQSVTGSVDIQAKVIGGRLVVDWEACPT